MEPDKQQSKYAQWKIKRCHRCTKISKALPESKMTAMFHQKDKRGNVFLAYESN